MDIGNSARKHGSAMTRSSMQWDNAIKLAEFEYDGEERLFVIGPDTSGNLLELVAVPVTEPTLIIMRTDYDPSSTTRCEAVIDDENEDAQGRDRP